MTILHPRATSGAAVRRPTPVRMTWLVVAAVALAAAAAASVAFGVQAVGWSDIVAGVTGSTADIASSAVAERVPRTVLAVLVGAALGLSGAVLQGVMRNPLADPLILGITPGASLAVVIGMAFFGLHSATAVMWIAILGAGAAALLVLLIGSLGRGGASPLKLTLAGAATAAAFGSLISAVLLPRVQELTDYRFWQVGGVGGATSARIGQLLPFLVIGALICLASARGLNNLALGDDLAAGLGQRVARTRVLATAGAIVLCGAATAAAGPIGFVGLAVPHVCRLLVGVDHRWLLPASAVVGAVLLTSADVVGRLVTSPEEIDVGIVTAVIGAPVFIWIVRRQRMRAL